ncbi:MAG: PP2C family protein-serine/threonine phosphatase [Bacteroidota bacterium]
MHMLEDTQHEMSLQSEVIQLKSEQIESKNTELQASLNYAQQIQTAVLGKHLFQPPKGVSDWFFFQRAVGTVSGDFFWHSQQGESNIVVMADCTGHGVPGALLTMLGSSILDQLVNELKLTNPKTILLKLHHRLTRQLETPNTDTQGITDGMDISVCHIDTKEQSLTFCGAYHPLYHIREGKLTELKGDRTSIGSQNSTQDTWVNQVISYQPNDMVYLTTDGFKDQFGGRENKRFSAPRLKDLLLEVSPYSLGEQKIRVVSAFDDWRGDQPQIDDVALMGLRL